MCEFTLLVGSNFLLSISFFSSLFSVGCSCIDKLVEFAWLCGPKLYFHIYLCPEIIWVEVVNGTAGWWIPWRTLILLVLRLSNNLVSLKLLAYSDFSDWVCLSAFLLTTKFIQHFLLRSIFLLKWLLLEFPFFLINF